VPKPSLSAGPMPLMDPFWLLICELALVVVLPNDDADDSLDRPCGCGRRRRPRPLNLDAILSRNPIST
jgi:hypothetical protein